MVIESNLFRIDEPTGIFTLYLDEDAGGGSSKALNFFKKNSFHFSDAPFLLGVITFVGGRFEEGVFDLIYISKKNEVENLAGYVEEPEDDRPFEFTTAFNSELGLEAHHHIVRDTGHGYAMVTSLVAGFINSDIDDVINLIQKFKFKALTKDVEFGALLSINLRDDTQTLKMGHRILISSETVS